MSHPTHEQIAQALGIPTATVSQLARCGMPTHELDKALAWYALYGRATLMADLLASKLP